jgi:hypothetical protein
MDPSESNLVIDWSAEPTTERERQIRAILLRNALTEDTGKLLRLMELLSLSAGRDMNFRAAEAASDFRAAWARAQAEIKDRQQKRLLEEIEEAIREVDASG